MYKVTPGIYTITNKINNKIYLGKSHNLKRRLNNHKTKLIAGIHENEYLQQAFNKYGIENFEFEILEEIHPDLLSSQENYWCNVLNVHNRSYGYNIEPICLIEGKRLISEETRCKLGANKGRKFSDETKRKQSEIRKGKPIHSEEFKKKLSIRAKSAVISEETRKKMSDSAKERVKRIGTNLTEYNKKKKGYKHI